MSLAPPISPLETSTTPNLQCEILDIVARHLISEDAFATCASLNATTHAVKEATLQTLWTHMYWTAYHDPDKYDEAEIKAKWENFKASPGAQFIRYMIEPHVDPPKNSYQAQPFISKSGTDDRRHVANE